MPHVTGFVPDNTSNPSLHVSKQAWPYLIAVPHFASHLPYSGVGKREQVMTAKKNVKSRLNRPYLKCMSLHEVR